MIIITTAAITTAVNKTRHSYISQSTGYSIVTRIWVAVTSGKLTALDSVTLSTLRLLLYYSSLAALSDAFTTARDCEVQIRADAAK